MRNGQKNGTWLEDEEITSQNEGDFYSSFKSRNKLYQVHSTTPTTSSTPAPTPVRTSTTVNTIEFSMPTATTIQSFTGTTGQTLNRGKLDRTKQI
jgi:hypothetical protein